METDRDVSVPPTVDASLFLWPKMSGPEKFVVTDVTLQRKIGEVSTVVTREGFNKNRLYDRSHGLLLDFLRRRRGL